MSVVPLCTTARRCTTDERRPFVRCSARTSRCSARGWRSRSSRGGGTTTIVRQAIERDFGPCVDGADPTEIFIASADGRAFGLIQRYRIDDNPEWRQELSTVWPVPPGALSMDYLIGEPAFRGADSPR